MSERLNVPHWINDEIKRVMKSESYFELRNKAFEEMNAILDANGDNPDDPAYREAFKRWQEIALGIS